MENKLNNNYPKISIVMPSFNQEEFIERSILSILNQNYPNLELIIIDGGSNNNTIDIIKKYEKYIFYWISEKDNGQTHALNKGFSIASGDIFGWQNSDDIYLPNTFNKVAKIFKNNSNINICYGNWYSINKKDEIIEKTYAMPIKTPHSPDEVMNIYNQATFWRKEVHRRLNKLDENMDRGMDYDLILRFLLNEKLNSFYKINSFLGALRRYEGQKSKTDSTQIKEEKYLEKKFNFAPKYSFRGILNHANYRFYQMKESLKLGGVKYTFDKFIKGVKRRRGIL
ncbi:MAG: glycosyltransferase family 2 protein [Candidatus Helarchaeota archaeon]